MAQEEIETAEKFAREEMQNFLEVNADLKDYYGIHFKNPGTFKFMEGEKVLLIKLINVVKNKDIEFWTPSSTRGTSESLVTVKSKNFNVNDEKKLKRSISTSITNFKKKSRLMNEQKEQTLDGNVDIDINMSAAYKDESQETVEYIAVIQCALCVDKVNLKKTNEGTKACKWVT